MSVLPQQVDCVGHIGFALCQGQGALQAPVPHACSARKDERTALGSKQCRKTRLHNAFKGTPSLLLSETA